MSKGKRYTQEFKVEVNLSNRSNCILKSGRHI